MTGKAGAICLFAAAGTVRDPHPRELSNIVTVCVTEPLQSHRPAAQ